MLSGLDNESCRVKEVRRVREDGRSVGDARTKERVGSDIEGTSSPLISSLPSPLAEPLPVQPVDRGEDKHEGKDVGEGR